MKWAKQWITVLVRWDENRHLYPKKNLRFGLGWDTPIPSNTDQKITKLWPKNPCILKKCSQKRPYSTKAQRNLRNSIPNSKIPYFWDFWWFFGRVWVGIPWDLGIQTPIKSQVFFGTNLWTRNNRRYYIWIVKYRKPVKLPDFLTYLSSTNLIQTNICESRSENLKSSFYLHDSISENLLSLRILFKQYAIALLFS